MNRNRKPQDQKIRPKELRQRNMSQRSVHNLRRDTNNADEFLNDNVFLDDLDIPTHQQLRNKSHRGNFDRNLSQGFKHTRDQLRKMKYVNKQREAENSKLFIYNVSKRYTVDDIYHHLMGNDIKVMDLWHCSHSDARRRSFVILVPNADIEY